MTKELVKKVEEIEEKLLERYERYNDIFLYGTRDPSWNDGVNINLVVNHIRYYKKQLEEVLGNNYFLYPECYWWLEPCKLPFNFQRADRKGFATFYPVNTFGLTLESCFVPNWHVLMCGDSDE